MTMHMIILTLLVQLMLMSMILCHGRALANESRGLSRGSPVFPLQQKLKLIFYAKGKENEYHEQKS